MRDSLSALQSSRRPFVERPPTTRAFSSIQSIHPSTHRITYVPAQLKLTVEPLGAIGHQPPPLIYDVYAMACMTISCLPALSTWQHWHSPPLAKAGPRWVSVWASLPEAHPLAGRAAWWGGRLPHRHDSLEVGQTAFVTEAWWHQP